MSLILTQFWPVFQSFKEVCNNAFKAQHQAHKQSQINIRGGLVKQVNAKNNNLAPVGQFKQALNELYYTPGNDCVLLFFFLL